MLGERGGWSGVFPPGFCRKVVPRVWPSISRATCEGVNLDGVQLWENGVTWCDALLRESLLAAHLWLTLGLEIFGTAHLDLGNLTGAYPGLTACVRDGASLAWQQSARLPPTDRLVTFLQASKQFVSIPSALWCDAGLIGSLVRWHRTQPRKQQCCCVPLT